MGLVIRHGDRLLEACLLRQVAVVSQGLCNVGHIETIRLRQWFSHIERLQLHEDRPMFVYQIRQAMQKLCSIFGGHRCPPAVYEGVSGGRDRAVYIGGLAFGNVGEKGTITGVDRLERTAVGRVQEFATDEHLDRIRAQEFLYLGQ
jgi:hypothetical protein